MYEGTDRVKQVNWLEETALDIVDQDQSGNEESPVSMVDYWLSISDTPDWFDGVDRNILIQMVQAAMLPEDN